MIIRSRRMNVAKLITLNDIMDMKERDELLHSKDTIITPSARD